VKWFFEVETIPRERTIYTWLLPSGEEVPDRFGFSATQIRFNCENLCLNSAKITSTVVTLSIETQIKLIA
jgi:hypothetical protein